VGAWWYAAALLAAPLVTAVVAGLVALALRSPAFLPTVFTAQDPLGLLLPGIVAGLWVGFFEEVGWTGLAVPRLLRQHSTLATGLAVGVVWGALHYPLFREAGSFSGALPLALLLVKLFSWLPAYRVLMVWMYDRTGSLLVTALMHASMSATSIVLALPPGSAEQSIASLLASASAWWVLVAVITVASRRRPAGVPRDVPHLPLRHGLAAPLKNHPTG
jgi:membrane protease YdiL (CAAX protease family)